MGGKIEQMSFQLHSFNEAESVVDLSDVIPDDVERVAGFRSGFPDGFKRARKAASLTQESFCEAFNKAFPTPTGDDAVSLETVRGWEQGRHLPRSIETLEKLCKFFSCSMNYLFGQTDQRNPDMEALSQATGLSKIALSHIVKARQNTLKGDVLNYVLERGDFIDELVTLFASQHFENGAIDIKFNAEAIWDGRFDAKELSMDKIEEILDDMIADFQRRYINSPDYSRFVAYQFLNKYANIFVLQDVYNRIKHQEFRYSPEQLKFAVGYLISRGYKPIMEQDGFDYTQYLKEE